MIAAPLDDAYGPDSGAAYLYSLESANPAQPLAALTAPLAAPAWAGASLATEGRRIVVGVPKDDMGYSEAGAVYVFDLQSATPTSPTARIANPTPGQTDRFGESVGISSPRIIVGAPNDSSSGVLNAGAAYVYDVNASPPSLVAPLVNPTPRDYENFGKTVAISGSRVAVSTLTDNSSGSVRGTVYLYDLPLTQPNTPSAVLYLPTGFQSTLGNAIAMNERYLVVGDVARDSGKVYVYLKEARTGDPPILTISNPSPATIAGFGYSVALSGTKVAVGAPGDVSGAHGFGTVHVFDLDHSTPAIPIATLRNPDVDSMGDFGTALALVGTQLLVSTVTSDSSPTDVGIAYLYDLSSPLPSTPTATIPNPTPGVGDRFGQGVALTRTAAIVGAPRDDTAGLDQRAAYVFELRAATPFQQWKLMSLGSAFAPSLGDADDDRLLNLAEYGLSFPAESPNADSDVRIFPYEDGWRLRTTFLRDPARFDVTIEVQAANALEGPWTTIAASVRGSPTTGPGYVSGETGGSEPKNIDVRDVIDVGPSSARFLRKRVTLESLGP